MRRVFRWLATRFSNLTDYRFELVAAGASGDLAYTLGYEHISFSMDGGPIQPVTLRVTHVHRREDGEWKIAHRHADYPRSISARPAKHRRSKVPASAGPRWVRTAPGTAGSRWSRAVTVGEQNSKVT